MENYALRIMNYESKEKSMQAGERYAIGVDYGSNSVRCLIVDCFNGREAGVSVWNYRGGRETEAGGQMPLLQGLR